MAGPLAQEVTDVLGSPSATTTISGEQLPAPDPKFGRGNNNNASHYWRANQS
jgi:arylsulfatase